MKDFPTKLGFSAESKKFVCCYTKSADFTTCEIIDIKTGNRNLEVENISGYYLDKNVDERFQQLLAKLNVQDRKAGEWPFSELKVVWSVEKNKRGRIHITRCGSMQTELFGGTATLADAAQYVIYLCLS